jgi:hypothetical protein
LGPKKKAKPAKAHRARQARHGLRSAIRDVHRDFHAEAEIDGFRGFPFHARILFRQ